MIRAQGRVGVRGRVGWCRVGCGGVEGRVG